MRYPRLGIYRKTVNTMDTACGTQVAGSQKQRGGTNTEDKDVTTSF
jgi:hypothetical protein